MSIPARFWLTTARTQLPTQSLTNRGRERAAIQVQLARSLAMRDESRYTSLIAEPPHSLDRARRMTAAQHSIALAFLSDHDDSATERSRPGAVVVAVPTVIMLLLSSLRSGFINAEKGFERPWLLVLQCLRLLKTRSAHGGYRSATTARSLELMELPDCESERHSRSIGWQRRARWLEHRFRLLEEDLGVKRRCSVEAADLLSDRNDHVAAMPSFIPAKPCSGQASRALLTGRSRAAHKAHGSWPVERCGAPGLFRTSALVRRLSSVIRSRGTATIVDATSASQDKLGSHRLIRREIIGGCFA
jgi:hypothetical protein